MSTQQCGTKISIKEIKIVASNVNELKKQYIKLEQVITFTYLECNIFVQDKEMHQLQNHKSFYK
jgi:hypothetical protein